jgi:hypothetical protein
MVALDRIQQRLHPLPHLHFAEGIATVQPTVSSNVFIHCRICILQKEWLLFNL